MSKKIVITGGSKGIGRACVEKFYLTDMMWLLAPGKLQTSMP